MTLLFILPPLATLGDLALALAPEGQGLGQGLGEGTPQALVISNALFVTFSNLKSLNLANLSFLSLFVSMCFYWIYPLFQDLKKDTKLPRTSMLISNILLSFLLILRWKESGHFPLSNLYESLMFLSWCFTFIHLLIETYTISFFDSGPKTKNLLGAITAPSALLINAFATFTLPKEMQESSPLVPALQSNWLMMHVTVMIISYAALIIGSLLSIAFLIVTFNKNDSFDSSMLMKSNYNNMSNSTLTLNAKNIASMLDNLSYRILGIGFPFLTIGILSGAVWANEAWGSYWSWDPKETWALLTWLIFAIYLHTRISKGWEGKKPAVIASLGFVIVWICYLGVNLIGEGLHSYGWITA